MPTEPLPSWAVEDTSAPPATEDLPSWAKEVEEPKQKTKPAERPVPQYKDYSSLDKLRSYANARYESITRAPGDIKRYLYESLERTPQEREAAETVGPIGRYITAPLMNLTSSAISLGTTGRADLPSALEAVGSPGAAATAREYILADPFNPAYRVVKDIGAASMGRVEATPPSVAAPEATTAAAKQAQVMQRVQEVEAAKRLGIEPFAPSLTGVTTAPAVNSLLDVPIVGEAARKRLETTVAQTVEAGRKIANDLGNSGDPYVSGTHVRTALDRFKDAKSSEFLDASVRNLPDDQLHEIIDNGPKATSVPTVREATYEAAWRTVPNEMREASEGGVPDPMYVRKLPKTQRKILNIIDRILNTMGIRAREGEVPPQAMDIIAGQAGDIFQRIARGEWEGTFNDVRNVRSEFRRMASGMLDTEKNTLKNSDLSRIQSAMTHDMIDHLIDIQGEHRANGVAILNTAFDKQKDINRVYDAAWNGTPINTKSLSPAALTGYQAIVKARQVFDSIDKFKEADKFTREEAEHFERLESLFGAKSAEDLSNKIMNAALEGKGNLDILHAAKAAVTNDEWGDIAASVFTRMARPAPSAAGRGPTPDFSIRSMTTRLNAMSDKAKELLFKSHGDEELSKDLDAFEKVAQNISNFESYANTSRSYSNYAQISAILGAGYFAGHLFGGEFSAAMTSAFGAAAPWAFARVMTSPAYVRWLTKGLDPKNTAPRDLSTLKSIVAKTKDPELRGIGGALVAIMSRKSSQPQEPQPSDSIWPSVKELVPPEPQLGRYLPGINASMLAPNPFAYPRIGR
jgi:hypothetical protein